MANKRSAIVKVMDGGRVTIPSEIRDIDSIKEGDYLEISIKKIEQSENGNRQEPVPQKRYQKTIRNQVVKSDAK